MTEEAQFAALPGLRLEYAWVDADPSVQPAAASKAQEPVMVFLHEGLGSVALWKEFPARLCEACGLRGLVYSRPGYGRSTPRAADERWSTDFMHRQAIEVLPALLETLGIDTQRQPPWLFAHSDGASIALIHAAHFPERVAGVVAMAPHVMVEDISIRSIRAAQQAYREGDLRERLARWHDDVDSAFYGWSDAWLHESFLNWSLEQEIAAITCPVLLIQGHQDEYGTMAQLDAIVRAVPHANRLALDACGHSPHRDHPGAVIESVTHWMAQATAHCSSPQNPIHHRAHLPHHKT